MTEQSAGFTPRFERVLTQVEKELATALARARAESQHPGIKGTKVELATRKVLRDHLPPNLSVGEGIVYDSFGDESGQMDIVVANGDQPFNFPWGEPGEYVIEGVSAVGEVKSNLTATELKDCIEKATKYKRLRQIVGENDQVTNLSEYTRETSVLPPFVVIAFESRMKMPTLLNALNDAPSVPVPAGKGFLNDTPQPPLDAVCVLGKGVAFNQRSGRGPAFAVSVDGEPYRGWLGAEAEAPLAMTLGWLHTAMPRVLRAQSVVHHYVLAPPRQRKYMVNKYRVSQGLEPIVGDLPPITIELQNARSRSKGPKRSG